MIRSATSADSIKLERVRAQMGAPDAPGHFLRYLAREGCDLFVIEEAEDIKGYCLYNRAPKYRLFARLGIPEVQDLAIAPTARRKGLASALLAHCEDLAAREGHTHIGIGVGLHPGYGPAQRLYVTRGYVPDGLGVNYDRTPIVPYTMHRVDDDLCLMLLKDLCPQSPQGF